MKRIILEVDPELHRKFKAKVYDNYSTIKDIIVEFMENYIKEVNKNE